ncbi:LysR family transcriptional regulator [Thioclava sp. FTW29]|uniref:LysR family transcriptional regulator n=1 Tax=Thioclava litoralis TaxID=3076557 RepID=A0ABZ1E3D0_9RHOB|nr:LysR family transcriptional regulator [Thioclava sp. FTW29]
MNEPTFRQIRYFVAVAREGQVSRAAKELNVSQSAVTTAIRQLEEIVGAPLFDRHAGGMGLTYEGTIFQDHARRVLSALDEAVRAPNLRRSEVEGALRLAMTYTVAGYYASPYLERFIRAFPKVTLQMVEAPREAIEDGLVSGRYDLALMLTSNIANQEGLLYETLLQSRRRLWVGAEHPLLEKPVVTLADVAQEPYVMLTVDEASNTAQRYWNHLRARPRIAFRTSSTEAVRSMVGAGMGVTILSDMVYRPWSLDGRRVDVITLADPIPTMNVGLAWAANVEHSAAVQAFCEFMHRG